MHQIWDYLLFVSRLTLEHHTLLKINIYKVNIPDEHIR